MRRPQSVPELSIRYDIDRALLVYRPFLEFRDGLIGSIHCTMVSLILLQTPDIQAFMIVDYAMYSFCCNANYVLLRRLAQQLPKLKSVEVTFAATWKALQIAASGGESKFLASKGFP